MILSIIHAFHVYALKFKECFGVQCKTSEGLIKILLLIAGINQIIILPNGLISSWLNECVFINHLEVIYSYLKAFKFSSKICWAYRF